MSSAGRRIQRQVSPSHNVHPEKGLDGEIKLDRYGRPILYANPPRKVFYQGRGRKLGVSNPKDAALLARLRREAKRRGEG